MADETITLVKHPRPTARKCDCGRDDCRRCRNRERQYRQRHGLPPLTWTRMCEGCGETFETDRFDKTYCTPACRTREAQRRYRTTDHAHETARRWREENRELQSEYSANWYRRGGAEVRARYKREQREKVRAHSAVLKAIADGRLVRQPCEVCGAETVDAHHDDYSKPLDVRWLCRAHHVAHHREEEPWQSR